MDIISRKEAKERGLKRYFTGKPCPHGHVALRNVSGGGCVSCNHRHTKAWSEKNRQYTRDAAKKYHRENADRRRAYYKEYAAKNKEKILSRAKINYRKRQKEKAQYNKHYYSKNKEMYAELAREWRRNNPERSAQISRKRKNNFEKSCIQISDCALHEIRHIYQQAALLRHLGYDYHVDHIVPLQGETVSGLHVPWNLQVIPAEENLAKSNKLLPEHALVIHA